MILSALCLILFSAELVSIVMYFFSEPTIGIIGNENGPIAVVGSSEPWTDYINDHLVFFKAAQIIIITYIAFRFAAFIKKDIAVKDIIGFVLSSTIVILWATLYFELLSEESRSTITVAFIVCDFLAAIYNTIYFSLKLRNIKRVNASK